ncbi:hypothetical protein DVH05_017128 [Phytophthora capsici]|nr:hypothetical protein DVH05_017128 [Phytophthora capsici]
MSVGGVSVWIGGVDVSVSISVGRSVESVCRSVESVCRSVESVSRSVELAPQSVDHLVDHSVVQLAQLLESEPINAESPGFEIASPLHPRGRSKQKAKNKKAKKNASILMAQDDSILHDQGMSRKTVQVLLSHEPTYASCAEPLRRFQLFVFEKKMKPPIPYAISQMPPNKIIMDPIDISRILTKDILQRASKKLAVGAKTSWRAASAASHFSIFPLVIKPSLAPPNDAKDPASNLRSRSRSRRPPIQVRVEPVACNNDFNKAKRMVFAKALRAHMSAGDFIVVLQRLQDQD